MMKIQEVSPAVLSLCSQNSWNLFRSFFISCLLSLRRNQSINVSINLSKQSGITHKYSGLKLHFWRKSRPDRYLQGSVELPGICFLGGLILCTIGLLDIWIFEGLLHVAVLGLWAPSPSPRPPLNVHVSMNLPILPDTSQKILKSTKTTWIVPLATSIISWPIWLEISQKIPDKKNLKLCH